MKRSNSPELEQTATCGVLPSWLVNALPKLQDRLRYAIEREATYPRRPELLGRLETIEKSARLLMCEMPDLRIRALLLDGDERIENENEIYHGLRDIADRAARVRARNPRKQGRGNLYSKVATGPNPMELCALMVAMVHCHGNGRWPGKGNVKVHQNCEALWKAAGGPQRAGWGEPISVAVWRNHLKAAQKYRPPQQAGINIQRILVPNIRRKPASRHGELGKLLYDHQNSHPKERVRKKTE